MNLHRLQRDMKALGLYSGNIDGLWGPLSNTAYANLLLRAGGTQAEHPEGLAWGAKVSDLFKERVREIADDLGIEPDWLMACMAFESGRSFRPDITNGAGSGATGLIQFMPKTAIFLNTTTAKLAAMSAEDQLYYVHMYFKPYKGRLRNLGDLYMAILWPAGVGKKDDFPLWARNRRPTTYRQNAGLDTNRDGVITRGEAVNRVKALLNEGLRPENRG